MEPDEVARFWMNVTKSGTCWLWTGADNGDGYGRAHIGGVRKYAHRASFEFFNGPIPEDLQIDHLCRNRRCVNPLHLEPVVQRTNLLRGDGPPAHNAVKDACVRGHEFTPENTRIEVRPGRNSARQCKACDKIRRRAARARRSAARAG